MKLLKKIGIFSILSILSTATFAKDFSFECLDKEKINYNLDFLEGKSVLLDTKSFEKDFKEGIECYSPATFSKMTYLKSNYIIEDKNFFYENIVNLGEQAYFLNGKIPKNSFLYSSTAIPVLLYKSNYLDDSDISDYYISFQKNISEDGSINEPLSVIYQSPYNFTRTMITTSDEGNTENILFYFNTTDNSDIKPLKESIESYFLNIIQKNKLPLKLQNTDNMEIMRVYLNGFYNSLNLLEPFLQVFLDHIDAQNLGFKTDLKMESIDQVFNDREELNPFTLFGEHVIVSYTFNKDNNTGLIAFSFIRDEEVIKKVQENYSSIN